MGLALTRRVTLLAALGLVPAVLSVAATSMVWLTLAWNAGLVLAIAIDLALAVDPRQVRFSQDWPPFLSVATPTTLTLSLEAPPGRGERLQGAVRAVIPPGADAHRHQQRFALQAGRATLTWELTSQVRGTLEAGELWLRTDGPLGLAARQAKVLEAKALPVLPDLRALSSEALLLARAHDEQARRALPKLDQGRELDSLREYRAGDDRRHIDWKASARRGRLCVRSYRPERNQTVMLFLDCGRHMAGLTEGRRRFDLAVNAALQLTRVCADAGDLVGLVAFGASVRLHLPPRRAQEALAALPRLLAGLDATLEESDFGLAFDTAFARHSRRSLVVVLTDLLDADSAATLLGRARRLPPRHLPLIATLRDRALEHAARSVPDGVDQAHQRDAAFRLEREQRHTVAKLRDAGARVLRATPQDFSAAAVNAYLETKQRGLL